MPNIFCDSPWPKQNHPLLYLSSALIKTDQKLRRMALASITRCKVLSGLSCRHMPCETAGSSGHTHTSEPDLKAWQITAFSPR